MDIEDLPAAIEKVSRTLSPDGVLHASIVHPLVSAGTFNGDKPEATSDSFLLKAQEEVAEFREEPSLEELSDVIVTLIGWLDLAGYDLDAFIESSRAKLETRTRPGTACQTAATSTLGGAGHDRPTRREPYSENPLAPHAT